jgi:hypothetical protein
MRSGAAQDLLLTIVAEDNERGMGMGVTMSEVTRLRSLNVLRPGASLLDIGSSNLYSASEQDLRAFMASFGTVADTDRDAFVARLSAGSAYGPNGGLNESFLGELLEKVGMKYLSFDIALGWKTMAFDLNRRTLDGTDFKESFDVVINYGTTEHLLNQINAFTVIHDATKPGGYMVHQLPSIGYVDHCYFTYTARFFLDIAGYNDYEVVLLEYQGPSEGKNLYSIVRDYSRHFPSLEQTLTSAKPELSSYPNMDVSLTVVLRKKHSAKFQTPMETSTSVGKIDIGEMDFVPTAAPTMSTLRLYKIAGAALMAALPRTPGAIVRGIGRGLGYRPK